jgi:hypothetical protein
MAKVSKGGRLNPYLLFVAAGILMSAGFLMGLFPVLIFAGVAPLFAIADYADGEHFWNKLELAGIALAIALFAAHDLQFELLVPSLLQAILFTLGFAAYTYTKKNLGPALGKLPLILFILALEYLVLKTGFGSSSVFFADAMQFKPEWLRWTSYTGYLGVSFWILASNLLLYMAVLRGPVSPLFITMFLVAVIAPIAYSYTLDLEVVNKQDMLKAYTGKLEIQQGDYFKNSEWVPRTAAWVSALILLFTFVKSYTRKK